MAGLITERLAYIGLGSNLGDRGDTLMAAVKRLAAIEGVSVRRISQFITTDPVGGPPDQPKYLNAAAEILTTLAPLELLAELQKIEAALGRDRTNEPRWGPRTCDMDILLMGDCVMETETLTIPHPRMHERKFVLRPLAQIAREAVHPVLHRTVIELLCDLEVGG